MICHGNCNQNNCNSLPPFRKKATFKIEKCLYIHYFEKVENRNLENREGDKEVQTTYFVKKEDE